MKSLAIAFGLLLCGCTPMPQVIERVVIQEKTREVPVPCNVMVDPKPNYSDSKDELRSLPLDQGVARFAAARELRDPYESELETALAKCKEPIAPH